MFNLDPGKLLIIGVVAILLLGPDRLPQVARQVGDTWKSFNEFRHRMEAEVRSNIPDLPSSADLAHLARSPSALLNHLGNMASGGEAVDVVSDEPTWPTSSQLPEQPRVGGGMNWVTAEYSTDEDASSQQLLAGVSPDGILPGADSSQRSLESVVAGDAILN